MRYGVKIGQWGELMDNPTEILPQYMGKNTSFWATEIHKNCSQPIEMDSPLVWFLRHVSQPNVRIVWRSTLKSVPKIPYLHTGSLNKAGWLRSKHQLTIRWL